MAKRNVFEVKIESDDFTHEGRQHYWLAARTPSTPECVSRNYRTASAAKRAARAFARRLGMGVEFIDE